MNPAVAQIQKPIQHELRYTLPRWMLVFARIPAVIG